MPSDCVLKRNKNSISISWDYDYWKMTPLRTTAMGTYDRNGRFKAPTETNTANESPMLHSRQEK